MPKLPPMLEALSKDAKGVAGAWFGMMRTEESGLTFQMVKGRPSPRAQASLDEMVAAGLVSVEPLNEHGGLVYKPLVDFYPLFGWLRDHCEDEDMGFKLVEPIGEQKPTGEIHFSFGRKPRSSTHG